MIKVHDQLDDIKSEDDRIVVFVECSLLTYLNQIKPFLDTKHTIIESAKLKQRLGNDKNNQSI